MLHYCLISLAINVVNIIFRTPELSFGIFRATTDLISNKVSSTTILLLVFRASGFSGVSNQSEQKFLFGSSSTFIVRLLVLKH